MSHPLRCHLHVETIGRTSFRVLTPRPQDGLRISTNRYHNTWHILCAPGHVSALRRLLWALAFERHEHTLVALTAPIVQPTPFDGAPSLPVIFANSDRVTLRHDEVRGLRQRLARGSPSQGTVKLQTFGLDPIDALDDAQRRDWFQERSRTEGWPDMRVELIGGAIVFYGPPTTLQSTAVWLRSLEHPLRDGDSNYSYIGESMNHLPPGEVQVFGDYTAMLTDARLVREQRGEPRPGETPEARSERLCKDRFWRSERRVQRNTKRREALRVVPGLEGQRSAR